MSLLSEAYEDVTMLDQISKADGYGGFDVEWRDGATFKAAIVLDSSMQARVAEKQGVTALYTITTRKNINLQYHNVLRRARDGKVFRVTSDGDDNSTPRSASLDMRKVTAEEWKLPTAETEGQNNG